MVQELDRWVVGQALEILAERERAGDPVSLHVNLSGASLTDISVLEFIERRLDEGDADPSRCTFEITQTARVEDYDTAAGFADRLTEFGCEVAIDDYGAGFGPFHYLKQFPFDVIKIDGAFIRDMPRNDADQLTVKAIVQIARGLGKTTIAEFVQDDDDDADAARVRRRHGPGLPPRPPGRRRRGPRARGRLAALGAGDVGGEGLEGVEVALQVLVGVGDRERPLLLGARGHEDAVVHVVEPGQAGELLVDLGQVVAVLIQPLGREDDAALGAEALGVGGQAVVVDDLLAALEQALVGRLEALRRRRR